MKSYLRYEPSIKAGVISSPNCNVIFDGSGRLALSGSLEEINIFNIRQASQVGCLIAPAPNYPHILSGEVQSISRPANSESTTIAAGYNSGDIRIFNHAEKSLLATLRGHRTGVTCLEFGDEDRILASGSADCNIIIWDMIAHVGLSRLRGHKDAITGVAFVKRDTQSLLVSSSKDSLLKVWDLSTNYCIQTVVGHRCEIWALKAISNEADVRILTGGSDEWIRGYRLAQTEKNSNEQKMLLEDEEQVLEFFGSIKRADKDRCTCIEIDSSSQLIGVSSTGKSIEFFKLRSSEEAKKKYKRRLKRQREKLASNETSTSNSREIVKATSVFSAWDESVTIPTDSLSAEEAVMSVLDLERPILSDEVETLNILRCSRKVRSLAFSPQPAVRNKRGVLTTKALVALADNTIDVYDAILPNESSEETYPLPTLSSSIELQGHRSDVRGVAISEDGLQIATCGSDGVKLWDSRNLTLIRSVPDAGFGLCLAFTPGSRYVILGTKDGYIQIADTTSGMLIMNSQSHEGAVWSISLKPGGKGFVTGGADKVARFWDFVVSSGLNNESSGGSLTATVTRELRMSHDILCVRYSYSTRADRLMVALGLLDNTVKVFYDDSLKFFLSLYGHKLPVMSLDFSHDGKILASGSADKTIKIWGMDFGDCHRSLLAHADSVVSICFQPETHYFFSCGKDGLVKYWDADRFAQVLQLPGHKGAAWALAVSPDSSVCVSVGMDRSVRLWERTEDMVFIEEEKERELEAQVDMAIAQQNKSEQLAIPEAFDAIVGSKTGESVKGGEALMEALDLAEEEIEEILEWSKAGHAKERAANIKMLGLTPHAYFLRALRSIKAPDLEQAMLTLPFHYTSRIITMLLNIARQGLEIELCARACLLLMRSHTPQIISTRSLLDEISGLKSLLGGGVGEYRLMIGTNLAGLRAITAAAEERMSRGFGPDDGPSLSSKPKKRKQSKKNHVVDATSPSKKFKGKGVK